MALQNILVPNNYNLYINSPVLQGSLIPDTDNTYDLGSNVLKWRNTYTYGLTIEDSQIIVNTGPDTRLITIVSPAPNDTMTTNAGVQTLTNKTLTSPVINTPVINSSGGLITLPAGPAILTQIETTTLNTTFSLGPDGTPSVAVNVVFLRVGNSSTGWHVTMRIPSFTLTAGTSGLTQILSASAIPAGYLPLNNNNQLGVSRIFGLAYTTVVITNSTGLIRIANLDTSPFTGAILTSFPSETIISYMTI